MTLTDAPQSSPIIEVNTPPTVDLSKLPAELVQDVADDLCDGDVEWALRAKLTPRTVFTSICHERDLTPGLAHELWNIVKLIREATR